jgi:hypothetical protein
VRKGEQHGCVICVTGRVAAANDENNRGKGRGFGKRETTMLVKFASLSAVLVLTVWTAAPTIAQDAMKAGTMGADSMNSDAMAPMMSEDDLNRCLDEAMAITFSAVAKVAGEACHTLHNGQDSMGSDAMMGGDAMAPKK